MKSPFHRSVLALAAIGLVAGASLASAQQPSQSQRPLKKYESGTKDFWAHPPNDWFLGDETEAQKGLVPVPGRPTPMPAAEVQDNLKQIKLAKGFAISVYASGVHQARQMAWGDNNTLFVGSFDVGNVYAVVDRGGGQK